MIRVLFLTILMPVAVPGATGRGIGEYVCIERLSERVLLAYWLGTGRCNLTAIQSQEGLVVKERMLTGLCAARKEGLTLEQAYERFSQHRVFPSYPVPQPGQWDYGMQERNIRNL